LKKSQKVVQYKKPFRINIGIIIFIVIFIYLVFNVFSYLTTTHISVYEVEQGTIAENNIYNGLVLRQEQVYYSNYSGSLNYYVREGSKVAYQDLIYSVDESGNISQMIESASHDAANLDSDDLTELEEQVSDFQNTYQSVNFYNVYSFKEDIDSSLNEILSMKALDELSAYTSGESGAGFHQASADRPGILLYYTDGYENVTTDTFSEEMFNESNYTRTTNKLNSYLEAGAPVYKLVTSELWNIVIPIDETLAGELTDDTVMQIRFVKDDKKAYANYQMVEKNNQIYLILSLKNSMVRYAKERYLEVELLLAEETGLKIPNSSIIDKEFYTIPIDYFMKGGDSNAEGLLIAGTDEAGNTATEFISPTIYYETDQFYYVDSEDVSAGDIVLKSDSNATYVVGTDTAVLKGVYNINKGYAVFKQIDILYQNKEYTIVRTGTTYGIALYDHIALDGSKVNENELIK
jgi:hypothetical protein